MLSKCIVWSSLGEAPEAFTYVLANASFLASQLQTGGDWADLRSPLLVLLFLFRQKRSNMVGQH